MKYFHKIADNVNVGPLMTAIARQPELWDEYTLRTATKGTPHSQVSDIWLWFNDLSEKAAEDIVNDKEVVPYHGWYALPPARIIVLDLMRYVEAHRLGRVIITKLPPGGVIEPHVDGGAPATYFTRYQLALQSRPGAVFAIGDEQVNFRDGEVWLINNQVEHSVVNNSDDDRIVMIMDMRTD